MAEQIESDVDIDENRAKSAAKETGTDPVLIASGVSILLSLYLFYIKGNKRQGIFVGHWAPTFLALASYVKQKDALDEAKRAV